MATDTKKEQEQAQPAQKPKRRTFGQSLYHYFIAVPISFFSNPFSFLFGKKNKEKKTSNLTQEQVTSYLSDPKAISGPEAHKLISTALEQRPDKEQLATAVAVDSSNLLGINMYGKHVEKAQEYNHSVGKKRKAIDVHPYRKAGAGANAITAYRNTDDGEIYILLGRKEKSRGKPADGLVEEWSLPAGYMQPYPLEGGRETDIANSEAHDLHEEAMLRGEQGNPAQKISSVAKVKYDKTLEHNVVRELEEETGIEVDPQHIKHVSTRSEYGVTNDPKLHTIVADYLVDLGHHSSHPPTQAKSDLKELTWIKIRDIDIDPDIKEQPFGSKQSRFQVKGHTIRDDHGTVINDAIHLKRDQEYKENFEGTSIERAEKTAQDYLTIMASAKALPGASELISAHMPTSIPPKPSMAIGPEAKKYYDTLTTATAAIHATQSMLKEQIPSMIQHATAEGSQMLKQLLDLTQQK